MSRIEPFSGQMCTSQTAELSSRTLFRQYLMAQHGLHAYAYKQRISDRLSERSENQMWEYHDHTANRDCVALYSAIDDALPGTSVAQLSSDANFSQVVRAENRKLPLLFLLGRLWVDFGSRGRLHATAFLGAILARPWLGMEKWRGKRGHYRSYLMSLLNFNPKVVTHR